ncbi:MAG: diacylglycerol kinase family protein [Sphingobacteriales bacterium]|nr:MAG: diacylglycerol kinase family protein [Sphingobacteriales bacterium]
MNNAPSPRTGQDSFFTKELNSFGYAMRGFRYVVKHERHIRIHLVISVLVILAGRFFGLSMMEWCFVVFSIGAVITAEMLNTSIEKLTDLVSSRHHPLAGLVKDISAGAVLVAALTAAVVGSLVFFPKLLAVLH